MCSVWLKVAGISLWATSLVSSLALTTGGDEKECLTQLLAELEPNVIKEASDSEGKQALEVSLVYPWREVELFRDIPSCLPQSLVPILFDLAVDKSKVVRTHVEAALPKVSVIIHLLLMVL